MKLRESAWLTWGVLAIEFLQCLFYIVLHCSRHGTVEGGVLQLVTIMMRIHFQSD